MPLCECHCLTEYFAEGICGQGLVGSVNIISQGLDKTNKSHTRPECTFAHKIIHFKRSLGNFDIEIFFLIIQMLTNNVKEVQATQPFTF